MAIRRFCLLLMIALCSSALTLLLMPPATLAAGFPIVGVLHIQGVGSPESIAVDTQTHMVYIGYEFPGMVVGFDPISESVKWEAKVGDSITDVQVDSARHLLYVASESFNSKFGEMAILNDATGKILFSAPTAFGDEGLAVDTKLQRVYVASMEQGIIDVFKLKTSATGKISAVQSRLAIWNQPAALGVNSKLGMLYIGDTRLDVITVYDEVHQKIVTTIPIADDPVPPLRVDEATGRVYVVCSAGQELDVIDGNTNTVIAHVPVTPYPEGVAFNTATGRIYVADEGNKDNSFSNNNSGTTITVIDGQTFQVLGTMQVGRGPDGVEADPQLQRVYVAAEDSNAIVEISDSANLPIMPGPDYHAIANVHTAISLLQIAKIVTIIAMVLTIAVATLVARSQRWHGRESPQIQPASAPSPIPTQSPRE
jgi:YVTN family beta-propeller protein